MAENQKSSPKHGRPCMDGITTKTRKRKYHYSEGHGYAEAGKGGVDIPFASPSPHISAKKLFSRPLLKDLLASIPPARSPGTPSVVSLDPTPFKLPKSSPALFVTPGPATPYLHERTPGGRSPFHSLFHTPTISRIPDETPVPAGSYAFDDPRFESRPPPPSRTDSEKAALSALRKRVAPTRIRKEQLDEHSSKLLADAMHVKAVPNKGKKRKICDAAISPNDPIASNNPLNVFTIPTSVPTRGRSISDPARPSDRTTPKKNGKRRKTVSSSEEDVAPDQLADPTPTTSPQQVLVDRSRLRPKVVLTAGQKLIRESRAIERAKQRDIAQASRFFRENNAT